jgi:hypothetical protein
MAEIDAAQRTSYHLHSATQQPALYRQGQSQKRTHFDQNRFALGSQMLLLQSDNFINPIGFLGLSPFRRARERTGERWIQGDKLRHYFQSHAVPKKVFVEVGAIFLPPETLFVEPFANVRAAQIEQGPDHAGVGHWPDAAQTSRSRPAQEPGQNRFRLIVQSMPGRDDIAAALRHLPGEKTIAHAPGLLFEIAFRDRRSQHKYRKAQLSGQISDEILIPVRFDAAQLMVDVKNHGGQVLPMQAMEQENRIRSTRNRYTGAASPIEHSMPVERRRDGLLQIHQYYFG